MKKLLIPLLSGGIDSTLAALKVIRTATRRDVSRVAPVFIDYGQESREQEWQAVLKVSERLKREANGKGINFEAPVKINLTGSSRDGVRVFEWSQSMLIKGSRSELAEVENRNMVLISVVASYAKAFTPQNEKAVVITGFRNEFYDTRIEFARQLNRIFRVLEMQIQIDTPVIEYEGDGGKKKLVDIFSSMGYADLINLTWSCYTPHGNQPCGKCPACQKRNKAIRK